jgi:XTP/dITP diphosphohydrolase
MKNIDNRNAHFMSVVAFGSPDEQTTCFIGKVKGKLSLEERGISSFGYDPIFIPSDCDDRTFAEMKLTEKNRLSHRGKALRKFALWYSAVNKRRF